MFELEKINIYSELLELSHDMVFVLDMADGSVLYMNKSAKEILGYTIEELNKLTIENIRRPFNNDLNFFEHLDVLNEAGVALDYAYLRRSNGSEIPVEVSAKIITMENKKLNLAIVRDITQRLDYEQHLKRENKELNSELDSNMQRLMSFKQALNSNSIVSISDPSGKITYVNDNFEKVSGYKRDEVLGKNHNIVRNPSTPPEVFKELWDTIKAKRIWKGILTNKAKDGRDYVVDISIVPILDQYGNIIKYIAARHEITKMVEQQKEIEKLALTDSLTKLGNRTKLLKTIETCNNCSIALIDINSFHEINDFYGDETGDKVLLEFVKNLIALCKDKNEIFRLSGDNFIILNTHKSKEEFVKSIKKVNEMLSHIQIFIDDKLFIITTTVAISNEQNEKLLSTVSIAHAQAKKDKLPFILYTKENKFEKEIEENLNWAIRIKNALEEDRIVPFFQPIVDSKSGEIVKYEALVRMIDENGKTISPYFFLERSKKSNQYIQITKKVLDKTLEAIEKHKIKCSINITLEDVINSEFNKYLIEKLSHFSLTQNITFELVESEGIENFDDMDNFITGIKLFGCQLAIDDFGTGYSNFEYLIRLNADIIKIDGSLIKNIHNSNDHFDIVSIINEFAKKKNIDVIAEFVSEKEILDKINELGIKYSQGYYFGEPKRLD